LQNKLVETANNARVPVDDLTKSFVRFDLVNRQLWWSQEETIKLLDTLAKGLSMTGATARETGSVMLQLSQAFGSWRLQGDEFRAISESMPMLLDILAKKLWVARWELKDLASDWVITSQVLKEALLEANEQINASFEKSSVTIGQKLTQIRNDAILKFWEIDKSTWFTEKIVAWLEMVRNAISWWASFIIQYKSAIWELLKITGAIIWAYGLLGLANILRTLPALFWAVTISTRRATMWISLMSSALISLRALLWPLNIAFIALSWAIYGGIKLYELYSKNADQSSQATWILTDKLNENIKSQKDLDKQYSEWKITLSDYTKKTEELKEKQEILNLATKQAEWTAYDYERALNALANTSYAPDTSWYARERAEIEKNIKASLELLNTRKQLGIVEIKKIQAEQKATAKVNKWAPLTGPWSTSQQAWLSTQLLWQLNQQVKVNKEIAKKQAELTWIDEAIRKIRAGVDYKWSYWKIVRTWWGSGTKDKWGGGWKSRATKQAEERAKQRKKDEEELKKKTEETKKAIEEKAEANKKAYGEIVDWIEKGIDWMENYIDAIEKANDAIEKFKDDAVSNIRDIDKELEKWQTETTDKIAQRYIEIWKQIEDIQGQIKEKLQEWNYYTTEWLQLEKDLKKLQEESLIARQNLTDEQIKSAKTLSELSETDKILLDRETQKKVLEEKKKIYEDVKNWQEINLQEIQDFENLKLAESLKAQQESLDSELQLQTDNLEKQRLAVLKLNTDKKAFEKDWLDFFGTSIARQVEFQKTLQEQLLKTIRLQKEAGIQGINFWKTPIDEQTANVQAKVDKLNTKVVNISQNNYNLVDFNRAMSEINNAVE